MLTIRIVSKRDAFMGITKHLSIMVFEGVDQNYLLGQLLRIVRAKLKELKFGQSKYTATILLAGIPNVGKSSIANNMHQIGRIGAAEKGKLKHAVVSPYPGETEDISSYKFGSHPNLYVLDTPGILRPEIAHYHSGAKLALTGLKLPELLSRFLFLAGSVHFLALSATGAIKDNLLDEHELARYFLAILNLSEEYKRWVTPKDTTYSMPGSLEKHRRKGQYASDFTQDFIVKDVRQTLFDCISSFEGDLENECDMERLIESQIKALQVPLKASLESSAHRHSTVATKLLKLYRTGRLGHYTLDLVDS
ncbi:DAR GTPase 2, mitochondrial-like isoform X3 [Zingiber officinale]|uniref:DAR GTPase 2, mitochondrial-like isoform X3 n=1 Tax=Zingiber officinale TaxID=94328 RepID=UPI001C4D1ADF|nr:DAR GTPase 2, mitochondrial-like isoform X3 [Zingiber officinale]